MQALSDESTSHPIPQATVASLEAEIQDYTDEIEQLQTKRTILRRRRNALVPILRLPKEILCEICLDVVKDFRQPLSRRHDWPMQWICVTHVCHHWREVVLAFARFWSHIVFGKSPQLRDLFLERSGQSPLTFAEWRFNDYRSDYNTKAYIRVLSPQAHRIKRLDGFTLPLYLAPLLVEAVEILGTTFGILEKLTVTFPGDRSLTSTLLTLEKMPQLRQLSCAHLPPSFLRPICGFSLTTLKVEWSECTVSDIVAVVKHLKMLRTLDLVEVFQPIDLHVLGTPVDHPAHLPKLQLLRLGSNQSVLPYARFIECCLFPGNTTVNIDRIPDGNADTNSHLISSLSSSASKLGLSFASCCIRSDARLVFCLWQNIIPAQELHKARDPIWMLFASVRASGLFTTFLSEFSLPRLESLSVFVRQHRCYVGYTNGLAYLDRHPTIRDLAVGSFPLASGFLTRLVESASGNPRHCLIPNLELLVLRGLTSQAKEKQREERDLCICLEEALRLRKDLGVPVKELRLTGLWHLQDYYRERLEDVVQRVKWK